MNLEQIFRDLGTHTAKLDMILSQLSVFSKSLAELESRVSALEAQLARSKGGADVVWKTIGLLGGGSGFATAVIALLQNFR